MKFVTILVTMFAFTASAFGVLPTFKHIVLIVQENRTPDNLFGGNPSFETGVNVTQPPGFVWGLDACFDPQHRHSDWEAQWPNDGTYHPCDSNVDTSACHPVQTGCLQNTWVDAGDDDPYFQIARNYGFANFMFQTNEGPSFPAHHFLFSGTSAPYTGSVGGTDFSKYFVSGNGNFDDTACSANRGEHSPDVTPDDVEGYLFTPPFLPVTWANAGYPCYGNNLLDSSTLIC